MRRRYHELDMPVAIIAGTEDRVINFNRQAVRLHRALPQSRLRAIAGNGHMVHQTATRKVKGAVDQIRKRM
jgi:pimeloyl-ACP methyl ester carboxylesterase